jgi:Uma2 family endonuclease
MKTVTEKSLSVHRFTVKEYHRLGELGILHEDDRTELLEGKIIDMTPIGSKHASVVNRLNNMLIEKLRGMVIVSIQNPIDLNEYSEPEPDIAILKPRKDFYSQNHPRPEDILFIIEVSDTSLDYDRSVKIPLYAKAGIQEVWLVDVIENVLEIYYDPSQGDYGSVMKRRHDQTMSPEGFPGVIFSADEVLGL